MKMLALVLPALLGAPLFAIIAAAALIGFQGAGIDLSAIAIEIFRIAEMPVLTAIPLFTFAGYLLSESQASQRLVRLVLAAFGWFPGGTPLVALVVCSLFTAFTGASGVTIVALGGLILAALRGAGYPERFGLGLVTSAGSLGLLLPPSIPLILYGIIAQQLGEGRGVSIDELFLAGLLPCLLMLAVLMGCGYLATRRAPVPTQRFSWLELGRALWAARWELPIPFVVLGGIYSGWFAVSEAAAVTALYVLLVELLVLREIGVRRLLELSREAMVLVGGVLIILAVSLATTNYLIDAQVPAQLLAFLQEHVSSRIAFLMMLNLFLLVLGALLDIFSALVIVVPLILPVAVGYGVDPVHLGIIFLANMQIGYFTPPIGMNLFIASFRFERPLLQLSRATLPFLAALLIALLVITYWPGLSLALLDR